MRQILFIIALFFTLYVNGQNNYVLENIFNLNLELKMHQDSLSELIQVKCPENALDSTFLTYRERRLNLTKLNIYPTKCVYREEKLQTYFYPEGSADSVLVFLTFYARRLISFQVYFSSDSLMTDAEKRWIKHFGKYTSKQSDKKTIMYLFKNRDPFYTFIASDKQAMKLMPSWCGNSNRKYRRTKSWSKLEQYLRRG